MAAVCAVAVVAFFVYRRHGEPPRAALAPRPHQNVLLVTIDTLRADALSCYGGPASTPALDALARGGVRFTAAHAQAVLTLPSHASILTGEYPFQHGIRDNTGYRLAAGVPTLATLLKAAGYATAAFVSGFPLNARYGLTSGFDVYDDRFGETRAPTEFVLPERPAAQTVPLAQEWIAHAAADRSRPWFAWVHVFDPHAPYRPPPPFDREYAGRPYYGEVAATDRALAPLLDQVRALARPTFVVVTGDHGEALGDHGEATHGLFAYESTLRVPLIIAEIGGQSGAPQGDGEVSSVGVRHVDIMPTVLEATSVAAPSGLPGRSLLPAAEREPGSPPRPSYFESMSPMLNRGWAPLSGVLLQGGKYIDLPIPELYDLPRDPGESNNLDGRAPDRERTLQAALRGFGASLPGRRQREDPETAARLAALGYVTGDAPVKARYTEADDPKRLVAIDEMMRRGVAAFGEHRYAEAASLYEDVIRQRPDMALAYRHLAFVQWRSGDRRAAVGTLQRAVSAGIRHSGIVTQLGTYLAESGAPAAAIDVLTPVASETPPDLDVLNALGIAFMRAGRDADARRTFERMLAIDGESGMALENLGALDLARSDFAGARRRFARAVAVSPQSAQAHAGLGVVAFRTGDRDEAIAQWTTAVSLDPTNFDALYNLATTLARAGRMDEAKRRAAQFVATAPRGVYSREIVELSRLAGAPAP